MPGSSARRKRSPWRTATPRSNRNRADLIDDAGALADQPATHAMQGLQVELLDGLRSDEPHRWALHCFGDRLGVAEIVLLSLARGRFLLPMRSSPYRSRAF
jgi:hypothetical protein